MIDIHAHIIPHIDDGADDLTDALLMAELAVESGVHTVIATPHSNIPGIVENYKSLELMQHFSSFQEKVKEKGIGLEILSGMEIFATEDIVECIKNKKVISLNHSGHYLMEFHFNSSSAEITEILEKICSMKVVPVIAHPERYICIQKNPKNVTEWIDMGCQLQMNKGSIFGSFGRNSFWTADVLLKNDCVTYIASDAHSPYRRTTFMSDINRLLQEEFSADMAYRILVENPQKYLIDQSECTIKGLRRS